MSVVKEDQYLSNDVLINNIKYIDVTPEELGTADTYNESKMLRKYLALPKEGQILVYKAAIQLAIVGYGNRNYGFIRIDEKNIINLVDVFKKYNIKYNEKLNAKYGEDELSVRRLLRLFRNQIQEFIQKTKKTSYLWNKYAPKDEPKYSSICFPGAEHHINDQNEAMFLYKTYNNLDQLLGTKFTDRLRRVYIARGIFGPEFFQKLEKVKE